MTENQYGLGFLRVRTQDLQSKLDEPSPGGLPTPMSSRGDRRRSSIGWSFMNGNASFPSQPSSVASFQSSHEPQTPPQHNSLPMDFSMVSHPNASFESFSVPTQHGNGKSSFQGRQIVPASSLNGNSSFDGLQDPEWIYLQRQSENTQPRHPYYTTDNMMPASGDFPSALSAEMHHSVQVVADQRGVNNFAFPNGWSCQEPGTSYPPDDNYHGARSHQGSATNGNMLFEWTQPMGTMVFSRPDVHASTIVPSDIVRDEEMLSQESHLHCYHDNKSEILSQCGEYYLDHDDHDPTYEPKSCVSDHDDTWVSGSSMVGSDRTSPTGTKCVKKDKRPLGRGGRGASRKRRSKVPKETVFSTCFNNREMDIHVQQPRNSKKHTCRYILESGQLCARAFERVEHLRRHEQIHEPMRPFTCPLHLHPGLKCHKLFGRRDNWRDHLRTHLSSTIAGRNERISFEALFALLRKSEEHEEAEKTINMLLKWKAKGGHEKSTSLPIRGARM